MKTSTLLAIGSALAWAALTPVMCRAQAEIAPDHFEMTNVEPLTQPTNAVTPNAAPARRQMSGEDELRFDQRSAGSRTQKRFLGAVAFDSSLLLMLVVGGVIENHRRGSVHSDRGRTTNMQSS